MEIKSRIPPEPADTAGNGWTLHPPGAACQGGCGGGVGGIVVVVAVAGVLLATGVLSLPGRQATAPPATSASMPASTLSLIPTLSLTAPGATETATPELATTSTAELVPTPTHEVLLYDDFGNPTSGGPTFGDDLGGEVGYGDNAFRIAFSQPGPGFHAAWSLEQYTDLTVETLFSVPEGVPEAGAGLTLRTVSDGWYLV